MVDGAGQVEETDRTLRGGSPPLAFVLERLGDSVLDVAGTLDQERRVSQVLIHDADAGEIEPRTLVVILASFGQSVVASGKGAIADGARTLVVPSHVATDEVAELLGEGIVVVRRAPGEDPLLFIDSCRAAIVEWTNRPLIDIGSSRGDLSAFAESVAALLGGPIILEDANLNVLAYSAHGGPFDHGRDSAILGGRTPDEWVEFLESAGVLSELRTTGRIIDLPGGPHNSRRRLVVGLRDQQGFLGLLWLAEADVVFGAREVRMLERVATLAASQVRDFHAQVRERASAHATTVRRLLEGEAVSRSQLEEAGLRSGGEHALLGVRVHSAEPLAATDRGRLVDAVEIYCRAYRWRAATCIVGDTCFVVVGSPPESVDSDGASPTENLARGLADNCRRAVNRDVTVALSERAGELSSVPALMSQVERCIDLVLSDLDSPQSRVVTFSDLAERLAVNRVAAHLLADPSLPRRGLEALTTLDEGSEAAYRRTLVAYLQHLGNASRAAEELGVHVTTLRYRLNRIVESTGIRVDDPTTRLFYSLLLWGEQVKDAGLQDR